MTKHYPALSCAVFDSDSPFRHLPRGLDVTQRRYLEAIRFAVEMAQLSHVRLRDLLTNICIHKDDGLGTVEDLATRAFLDAWSIVDSIHRLRDLLSAMPKMKKRGPMFDLFIRNTQAVEGLRNRIQHLRGDLADSKLSHLPVWGTISWLWVINAELTRFLSGVLTAGPDAGTLRLIPTPGNRVYHDQLDHIILSVGQVELDLSEAMRLVIRMARGLEKSLRPQFADQEILSPVDMMLLLEIEMRPDDGPTS